MTAPVPLEFEEDNEELARRDALLKNHRGRELASLLALERMAEALERIRGLMTLMLGELETQRRMANIRGNPRKPPQQISQEQAPQEQAPQQSETSDDLPEMPS